MTLTVEDTLPHSQKVGFHLLGIQLFEICIFDPQLNIDQCLLALFGVDGGEALCNFDYAHLFDCAFCCCLVVLLANRCCDVAR